MNIPGKEIGEALRKQTENLKESMNILSTIFAGTADRLQAAKDCAEKDAPILKKDVKLLTKLYETLFLGICTDDLFKEVRDNITAEQRWNLVEPFTW